MASPMGYNQFERIEKTDEFRDWLDALKDVAGRARILMRIDRLAHGNPGDHRNLTHGVSELKIDAGPGYRVYFTQRDFTQGGFMLILLLVGGDKSSQTGDIRRAIELAEGYGGAK